eukprot:5723320-Prymnesium_polylepis.1
MPSPSMSRVLKRSRILPWLATSISLSVAGRFLIPPARMLDICSSVASSDIRSQQWLRRGSSRQQSGSESGRGKTWATWTAGSGCGAFASFACQCVL